MSVNVILGTGQDLCFFDRLRPFLEVFSEGQVKIRLKSQILKLNLDEKGVYFHQFLLRNLMMSFVFSSDL